MDEKHIDLVLEGGGVKGIGIAGQSLSVLFEKGIYEGDYVWKLVSDLLDKKGVRTFGDLKIATDPDQTNDKEIYKLVVLATDVTRGKLIRLPWDYHEYGLDPDTQLVADAVRASTAIPFYYEPSRLGDSYIVDGGIVSNFPIWVFEGDAHQHSQTRPTIGVKLSAQETVRGMQQRQDATANTFNYAFSIISTILEAQDQVHVNDPCTVRQTIFVDGDTVAGTDFSLSREQQQRLYQNGVAAAEKFLKTWEYKKFLALCTRT